MSRIRRELEKARADLLDLGLRNTLLNHRKLKSKGVEVVDEVPGEVFRLLVEEERAMSFLPVPEELAREEDRRVSGDLLTEWLDSQEGGKGGAEEPGVAERHQDTKLQTPFPAARLERVLLNTYYTARSTIEEQGVNTLYLALGMLRWFESTTSEEERSAPLILVPVSLDRSSARAKFRIRYTGEELGDNLSLQAKLHAEFRIDLPPLPLAEDLEPERYFEEVASAIREQDRWKVDTGAIHLGFFWFTKLLMYEDLDPERWPEEPPLDQHAVLGALLGDGFAAPPSPFSEGVDLDEVVAPGDLHQIRDADSSQTLAILDVHAGRNLVIQGPPGTGKSQTISNLIAESVARGDRVLFVAEKMAALDVVKRRLDEDGVGDACLELHSHRTNKRMVLEELRRTLSLGKPRLPSGASEGEDLETLVGHRDRLNEYAATVHAPIGETGVTPYRAYGEALAASKRMRETDPVLLEHREGWADWTAAEFRRRIGRLQELETLLETLGIPAEHAFWSSRRTTYIQRDRDRLVQRCHHLSSALDDVQDSLELLAELLDQESPDSLTAARRLIAAADRLIRMPGVGGMAVGDSAWHEEGERLAQLVDLGLRHREVREEYDDKLLPEAWERDVLALRTALVQFGDRWWRLLAPDFRRAISELRMLSRGPLPKAVDERVSLVDAIRESQRLEKTLDEERGLLERLFGDHWRGVRSSWDHLNDARRWLREVHEDMGAGVLPRDFLSCIGTEVDSARLHGAMERASEHLGRLEELLEEIGGFLQLDRAVEWLRTDGVITASFETLAQRISDWRDHPDSLHDIVRFNHLDAELRELELGELADLSARWPAADRHLADLLTYEWHGVLIERAMGERDVLARFEGQSHRKVLEAFQQLDRNRIVANRARVALAHWERLPPPNGAGQLGVLRHEMEKKRRHLPIRQLMERAGDAIQRIKPVFMMSPLSVATYIPPGSVEFDVVVFDEASQIRPVEAFGALLRGRRAVVVGDSKQLPPTPFFEKLVDDADLDEEERSVTGDLESILGLFLSKGAPERMLRWHYRSRHDSLIAVSNHEFYDGKLFIFPSPDHAKEELGVVLHHHPETVYEPGTKRYNLGEAEVVADAVMEHAHNRPDLTLGVAAFSQSQAQAVQDQVEVRRRQSPELEGFFNSHPDEPFFVKNLENVQGDERDIILISVGYGKQEGGALWMNFGPLNQEGGERRLNVLTTRARLRCEVFANFKADEIDLSRTGARGVAALKRYLQFAEDGRLDLAEPSDRGPDSIFEELVAERVRSLGYEVHPQVGSAGFFIDLAIVDPERPGRYLLGVECDGRSYHSASWARDRDRLRQEILEGLGWSLHRIWSTDWFRNPERELRRVVESLERARARGGSGSSGGASTGSAGEAPGGGREPDGEPFRREGDSSEDRHLVAEPYRCADVSRLRGELRGHELHGASSEWLARWVTAVVEVESPVHESEVVRRIVDGAGYQRSGSRLQATIERGITEALRAGAIERRGSFLWDGNECSLVPRDRGDRPVSARRMDLIASEEVEAAVLAVVAAAAGIGREEATVEVARLFGFARTTPSIGEPILRCIESLEERGVLEDSGDQVRVTER